MTTASESTSIPQCSPLQLVGSRPEREPLGDLKRVLLAAQVSAEVDTALILVQNLITPPTTLMRPGFVRMVLRTARVAERRIPSEIAQEPAGARISTST